jgi:hypothetical protein
MTATRIAASSGGGSTFAGVYDITASPYNATTGATDNTTAIQAAITAAKGSGGIVYVPPGVFKYASPLVCDQNSKGFSIVGAGGGVGEIAVTPSELRYTGTTSPAISCHSVFSFSLRDLRLTYDNAGFTGDLVDIDGGPHAADCTNWSVIGCSSKAVGASRTARSIVRLNKAINGKIADCGWADATNLLRFGDPATDYVVGVKVEGCTFNYADDAMIALNTGDGENLTIDNCRFEASINTTAIKGGAGNLLYNPVISNCWFGDASASFTWITGLSSFIAGVVSGCRFAAAGGGVYLNLGGKWVILGNSFENGSSAFDSGAPTGLYITSIGNQYGTTRIFPAGWDPSNQSPRQFVSINDQGTAAELGVGLHHIGPYIGIRANENVIETGGPENFTLGAQKGAGLTAMAGTKAAAYWGSNIGSPYNPGPVLAVQAPHSAGFSGHVALMSGPTPAPVVHVESNGLLGFHGSQPVAKATVTGSRGGNAALASLLSALASKGLITDSSTA